MHFVGRLDRQAVAEAMAGATLFVMPSRLEPFGIVILEAWRAGVAVVATNHGGAPEFVRDGQDGVLVDPFDTGGFRRRLGPPSGRSGRAPTDRRSRTGPGRRIRLAADRRRVPVRLLVGGRSSGRR